ncbi:DUF881 domain-containing protein [Actinomyces mediterranea]|uniref:DUF881 domain-containing protein n=1 Tax=Actinomyces mediterranea TaxID=1871028 RepID=UPI001F31E8BE|nr:DUF881 domain-containing protein [Actinomyces mediterranea]
MTDPSSSHSDTGKMAAGSSRRLSARSAASILIVTIASGMLFAVSASTNRDTEANDASLVALVKSTQEGVADLDAQVSGLRADLAAYSVDAEPAASTTVPGISTRTVSGPGVRITLTDANLDSIPEGATANDLVIHQQDIEDVMNALWNGGAEAMTVQGVRVTGRTVIRCIGNVILVDGESYAPPYVIEAIGDIDSLKNAVNSNPRIVNYKEYVTLYGLGWTMESSDDLSFPAANTKTTNSYAQVVDHDE